MLQIAYLSRSKDKMNDDELMEILEVARRGNADCDVTGILLHADGAFFQVLEGDAHTVRNLFDRIWSDSRHKKVWILHEREIETRDFPQWSMGFQPVEKDAETADAFFSLTRSATLSQADPMASEVLMKRLRQFAELRVDA